MAGQNNTGVLRTYGVAQLGYGALNFTTGTWTSQLASNVYTLHKAAAATTSVTNFAIPPSARGFTQEDYQVSKIEMYYQVTTADLTTAPSAILNNISTSTTTGAITRTAITQAITFSGIDTVGKVSGAGAAGSHIAIVTITTPAVLLDTDTLVLSFTMGEAATSVLDISSFRITYV
jgi:hypothetical protein